MQLYEITKNFLDYLETQTELPLDLPIPDSGARFINSAAVDTIANELMMLVADVVASLIDAGSEREAVLENEELRAAITKELNGWTEKEDA